MEEDTAHVMERDRQTAIALVNTVNVSKSCAAIECQEDN